MRRSSEPEPALTDQTESAEWPLFPLHDVLFPGGTLPLRIFEARYLDLLARSMQGERHFGVVLIKEGHETGLATFYRVGTTAAVVDWSQGRERFDILGTEQRPDGLYVAQVKIWPAEPRILLPCEYQHMATVVEAVLDKLKHHARYLHADYDDSSWIGYRLAEILSLGPEAKQEMLELRDPVARLDQLGSRLEE